ncbi:MAG: GDP-mannose 4,6-dehydratase, partial [Candidatus Hodarchaeales archaeon]
MKLVVITGCLGLIGNYVTKKCLEQGWKVYGIDKKTYAANEWALEHFLKHDNFTFLEKDICELKSIPDCDYVINIAAESHVENSIIESDVFMKTNVLGVKNLLNIIKNKHNNVFKRPVFFHFSTDEVYGDIKSGSHTESDILKPSNPYSASKAAADMLVLAWSRTYDLEYIILRPTNNYGIGQYCEKLIPLSVKLLSIGRKINLHDEGKPVRTWLHAEDTASAVIDIIISGKVNEIYNVSGNLERTNYDTASRILEVFYNKKMSPAELDNFFNLQHKRRGQDIRYSLDDSKLKELGWKPIKIFDQEIEKIVSYY